MCFNLATGHGIMSTLVESNACLRARDPNFGTRSLLLALGWEEEVQE